MPDLLAIYTALAALPVTLDGAPVPVITPSLLPVTLSPAHLPARLQLPPGGGLSVEALSLDGTLRAVRWRARELLLVAPVGHGRGLADSAPSLARAASAVSEALHPGMRLLPNAVITGLTASLGVYAYPDGGAARFYGVDIRLTIRAAG